MTTAMRNRYEAPAGVTCNVELITPQVAEQILAANHPNRPTRDWKVRQIAKELTTGKYQLNGETVKLCATHGGAYDSKHRLLAIVLSGVPMLTFVVRGLSCDVQETVDLGAARSPGNILSLAGYKNPNDLAAAARIILRIETDNETTTNVVQFAPSRHEIREVVERHPTLWQSISIGEQVRRRLPITRAMAGALHCWFSEIDKDAADAFFGRLISGENLLSGDPVLALRRWLENSRSTSTSEGRKPIVTQATITLAWNATRTGKRMSLVRWRPFEEHFPKPI